MASDPMLSDHGDYHCGKAWCPTKAHLLSPAGHQFSRDGTHLGLGMLIGELVAAPTADARSDVLDKFLVGAWGFAFADIQHKDRHLLFRDLRGLIDALVRRARGEVVA